MPFYAVNEDTVICINPKAGSMSMHSALSQVPYTEVRASDALNFRVRVMFPRQPVNRLNSLFNMLWRMTLNNSSYEGMVPKGTIQAYSARVESRIGSNEHRWTDTRRAEYTEDKRVRELAGDNTDARLIASMNNDDYHRFVDYILADNHDDHWGSQIKLCTEGRNFIPTVAHRFEDVNTYWTNYVNSPLPTENSWPSVTHDEYRLSDLNRYYADDIAFWEGIDGTWNAG